MSKKEAVMEVDKDLIDRSVEFINAIVVKTMYKGSLEIGEYLLINFFNNKIEQASSKNRNKAVSFQELCKRPDLGVHPSTLSRMVRVASQERYFLQNKASTDDLSYSHRIEFTKIDNDEKKIRLVKKCIQEKMSCRELSKIIFAARQELKGVIEPSPLKLISSVDRLIEGTQIPTLLSKPEKLERMRPNTRTVIKERASDLLEKMSTITKECNRLIKTLDKIEEKKKLEKEKKEREKKEKQAEKEKGKTETKAKEEPKEEEKPKSETEPKAEEEPETEAETKEEEKPKEG